MLKDRQWKKVWAPLFFLCYVLSCWKMHISALLIENFPREYGWWSWAKETFSRATHGWGKIALQTCSDLSEPVRTCPQYNDHVCSSRHVIFCTFECSYSSVLRPIQLKLHLLTRLIESVPMVYRLWRSKIVDPSRSPCLKTIDRKLRS